MLRQAAKSYMELNNKKAVQTFLDSVDTFLFDCDGVIWIGSDLLYKVKETLDFLQESGKKILFVTNNSTNSRKSYSEKFKKKGLDVNYDQIFGSAYAAAYYVKTIPEFANRQKKVFVIGQQGIIDELESENIDYTTIRGSSNLVETESTPTSAPSLSYSIPKDKIFDSIKPDNSVGAVLMGFDIDISYRKLAQAFTYLHHNPACLFLATNADKTYPASGTLFPGTGSIVAAVAASVGKQPKVLGKPEQNMLTNILKKYDLNPERTCMVGDRLDTDILFGQTGGLQTLCVLTGVTSKEQLLDPDQPIKPQYWMNRISDIYDYIKS